MKSAVFVVVLFIALPLCVSAKFGHSPGRSPKRHAFGTATSIAPSTTTISEGLADGYQALDIVGKSQTGILRMRGYEGRVHYAVTKDGYHVHLVRIINPYLKPGTPLKRPIVFNHGLIESSTIWLINSHNVGPVEREGLCDTLPLDMEAVKNSTEFVNGPMMLSNFGYDVWLMSMRGTDFSMYNQEMDPSLPEFWDYSLDNFGLDDVPTVINYIRRQTGFKKVGYIGHSQATFSVFALLSAKPEFADVIEPVIAVAPVAYMHHTTSIARGLFMSALDTPDIHGPVPETAARIRSSLARLCAKNNLHTLRIVCGLVDALVGGNGSGTRKGYFSHFPYYTSQKVFRHFGQLVKKQQFGMYDYGPQENQLRYGSTESPLYNIGHIRSKSLTLIWTKTDLLSDVRDVERFKHELKVPLYRDIFIDRNFNHFDLITHDDSRYLVWAPILEVLEEFEVRNGICTNHGHHHNHIDNHASSSHGEHEGASDDNAI